MTFAFLSSLSVSATRPPSPRIEPRTSTRRRWPLRRPSRTSSKCRWSGSSPTSTTCPTRTGSPRTPSKKSPSEELLRSPCQLWLKFRGSIVVRIPPGAENPPKILSSLKDGQWYWDRWLCESMKFHFERDQIYLEVACIARLVRTRNVIFMSSLILKKFGLNEPNYKIKK